MAKSPTIEVCVESVEGALTAEAGGADRVELCADLVEGGITPSMGSIRLAKERLGIPTMVMIRPRGGDFVYSRTERDIMVADIAAARDAGVHGVVFGQEADAVRGTELLRELIERAADRIIVMPGGGILPERIAALVAETGCREVHFAALEPAESPMQYRNPRCAMGATAEVPGEYERVTTNLDLVRRVIAAARGAGDQGPPWRLTAPGTRSRP